MKLEVKLVAVVGISASGKSTAAHGLARCLHSPFFPFSLDSFFDEQRCLELGTYEDWRCIASEKVVRWLRRMKQCCTLSMPVTWKDGRRVVHRKDAVEAWRRGVVQDLPEAAALVPPEVFDGPSTEPSGVVGTVMTSSPVLIPEAVYTEVEEVEEEEAVEDADAHDSCSLAAHEEEDAARRRLPGSSPSVSSVAYVEVKASTPAVVEVFVVWEGINLLGDAVVSDLFDLTVLVSCDAETACLRRFFRSPRRRLLQHLNTTERLQTAMTASQRTAALLKRSSYRPRIAALLESRLAEGHRASLTAALRQEILRDGSSVVEGLWSDEMEPLLQPSLYNPPLPGPMKTMLSQAPLSAGEDGELWQESGAPTAAFQLFWTVTFPREVLPKHPALKWAAIGHSSEADETQMRGSNATHEAVQNGTIFIQQKLAELGRRAMAKTPTTVRLDEEVASAVVSPPLPGSVNGLLSDAVIAEGLSPFYYEFRYWFMFEVMFYAHLLRPLQRYRLAHFGENLDCHGVATLAREDAVKGREECSTSQPHQLRDSWTLRNGWDSEGESALQRQIEEVANAMVAHRHPPRPLSASSSSH